jgi:hypothetical protein
MKTRRQRMLIPIGLLCISLSVFIGRIAGGGGPHFDFLEGMLTGMALGISVVSLVWNGLNRST